MSNCRRASQMRDEELRDEGRRAANVVWGHGCVLTYTPRPVTIPQEAREEAARYVRERLDMGALIWPAFTPEEKAKIEELGSRMDRELGITGSADMLRTVVFRFGRSELRPFSLDRGEGSDVSKRRIRGRSDQAGGRPPCRSGSPADKFQVSPV